MSAQRKLRTTKSPKIIWDNHKMIYAIIALITKKQKGINYYTSNAWPCILLNAKMVDIGKYYQNMWKKEANHNAIARRILLWLNKKHYNPLLAWMIDRKTFISLNDRQKNCLLLFPLSLRILNENVQKVTEKKDKEEKRLQAYWLSLSNHTKNAKKEIDRKKKRMKQSSNRAISKWLWKEVLSFLRYVQENW